MARLKLYFDLPKKEEKKTLSELDPLWSAHAYTNNKNYDNPGQSSQSLLRSSNLSIEIEKGSEKNVWLITPLYCVCMF